MVAGGGRANTGVSPLRFAPVEMTRVGEGCGPIEMTKLWVGRARGEMAGVGERCGRGEMTELWARGRLLRRS